MFVDCSTINLVATIVPSPVQFVFHVTDMFVLLVSSYPFYQCSQKLLKLKLLDLIFLYQLLWTVKFFLHSCNQLSGNICGTIQKKKMQLIM